MRIRKRGLQVPAAGTVFLLLDVMSLQINERELCWFFEGKDRLLICSSRGNNSSLQLESDCSEEENLEGKLFMPRDNFHFPRLDSCLTARSVVRQSKLRKMEILSRHGMLPDRFSSEE